jgi:hypothetical protein
MLSQDRKKKNKNKAKACGKGGRGPRTNMDFQAKYPDIRIRYIDTYSVETELDVLHDTKTGNDRQ